MSQFLIQDVQTIPPLTVAADAPLREAVKIMADAKVSCLMVLDPNTSSLAGIVTERDIARVFAELLNGVIDSETPVAEVMTAEPVCVSQSTAFDDALMLSRSRGLRHLPVLGDNNELLGIVTQTNLLKAYSKLLDRQADLEKDVEELKLLSLEDALLRIGNRRAMEVDLAFTQAESQRYMRSYAIALLDIDNFKKYNDFYGHQQGDEALRATAAQIKGAVRDSDRIFRYGGEEILLLMPETDISAAQGCAERVRSAVESMALEHSQSDFGVLTVSAGVCAAVAESWQDMVDRADEALYRAKNDGRNRVSVSP